MGDTVNDNSNQPSSNDRSAYATLASHTVIMSRGFAASSFAAILILVNRTALSAELTLSLYFLVAALPLNLFVYMQKNLLDDFGAAPDSADVGLGILCFLSLVLPLLGFFFLFSHFGYQYGLIAAAALVGGEILTRPAIVRCERRKKANSSTPKNE